MIGRLNIQEIMQKDVSRKEFLRYVGIAFLSVIGVAAMMQNIQSSLGGSSAKSEVRQSGYGGSAYGK